MDENLNLDSIWPGWEIENFVGAGSFGNVYRVKRELRGHVSHAAVKIIEIPQSGAEIRDLQNSGMDVGSIQTYYQEMVDNLMNEIAIMESLKSADNIVTIEDYAIREKEGEIGWTIYIRMEFLTDLGQYLKTHKRLTPSQVLKLGKDICQALIYCDKVKIIHRDIKIDNVFLNEFGSFKLGDFGISKQLEKTSSALSQKGTNMYMAPEVFRGEKYGKSVDFYSLGIMMYRLLNEGRFPFFPTDREIRFSDTQEAIKKRLSGAEIERPLYGDEELWRIIQKACAFDDSDRYQSAEEMLADLKKYEEEIQESENVEVVTTDNSNKNLVDEFDDSKTVILFQDDPDEADNSAERNQEDEYNNETEQIIDEEPTDLPLIQDNKTEIDLIENPSFEKAEESVVDNTDEEEKEDSFPEAPTVKNKEEAHIDYEDARSYIYVEGDENEASDTLKPPTDVLPEESIEKSEQSPNESSITKSLRDEKSEDGVEPTPNIEVEEEKEEKKKKSLIGVLIAIGVVAIVGIVLFIVLGSGGDGGNGENDPIVNQIEETVAPTPSDVPKETPVATQKSYEMVGFSGMTKAEVESELSIYESAALSVEYKEKYTDTDVDKGKVIEQSVKSGYTFAETDPLTLVLTLSKGIERVVMPNIEDKSLADAKAALKALGLKVKVSKEVYSSNVASGNVVSQSVKPKKKAKKGSTITLTVSKGPEPQSNGGGGGSGESSDSNSGYDGVPLV